MYTADCAVAGPVRTAGTAAALPAGACPAAAARLTEESGSTLISLFGTGVSFSTVSGAQAPLCCGSAAASVGA
ncbi:hypothetical protein [Kitasatospora fiedleri]|uniref:hypothetical protein n=1 Tax=Kitasatospora fiedleri TaxID=2991545 RepID=UPI002499F062|nr:hypothetical protein [Kitasatospora fiedleri]